MFIIYMFIIHWILRLNYDCSGLCYRSLLYYCKHISETLHILATKSLLQCYVSPPNPLQAPLITVGDLAEAQAFIPLGHSDPRTGGLLSMEILAQASYLKVIPADYLLQGAMLVLELIASISSSTLEP